MESFIKSIFYGDKLGVENFIIPNGKQCVKLRKQEDELYEKLKTSLSDELFKTLSAFIEVLEDRHALISEQYYTAGFKTGLHIAMEAFNLSDVFDT